MERSRNNEERNRIIPLINEVIAQMRRISMRLWLLYVDTASPLFSPSFINTLLSEGISALKANHNPIIP
jgi:hypothetical protein